MAEIPELSQSEVSKREEPETIEGITAEFAFMVVKTKEGQYMMVPDINSAITIERSPTMPEIKGALNVVLNDINNQETAQMTVVFQQIRAQQLFEQQQNQQLIKQLSKGGLAT